jgi:fatty acid-binding protein DegV
MAKLTKIVPIIEFKNGKLEKGGKGRIFNKTIIKITKKIHNKHPNAHLMIYHANNHEINEIKEKIEKI